MKLLIFVSSNCPYCPKAERVVKEVAPSYEEKGLSYEKIRMKTPEGKELSSKYKVMSNPTILFLDGEEKEVGRIVGVPSEPGLKKKIEKFLGLRKSFIESLFNKK